METFAAQFNADKQVALRSLEKYIGEHQMLCHHLPKGFKKRLIRVEVSANEWLLIYPTGLQQPHPLDFSIAGINILPNNDLTTGKRNCLLQDA